MKPRKLTNRQAFEFSLGKHFGHASGLWIFCASRLWKDAIRFERARARGKK